MIYFIAPVLCIILTGVAVLHLHWVFGGYWPAANRAALPQTVVGSQDITRMPPAWLTVIVALLIFAAGMLPMLWVFHPLMPRLLWLAMTIMTAIFTLRGIASFTPYWRKMQAGEPFATLDRKYFGPLCLTLGFGFAFLLL